MFVMRLLPQYEYILQSYISTLRKYHIPLQSYTDLYYSGYFVYDIFKKHFSLMSVPQGSIDDKSTLVQEMGWGRIGDKLLHKPMLTQTHVYVTRRKYTELFFL